MFASCTSLGIAPVCKVGPGESLGSARIGKRATQPQWLRNAALSLIATSLLHIAAMASQHDIATPAGSVSFGDRVTTLPNGNIVVVDPDGPVSGVGAVYLYSPDGALISTLQGSQAGDHIGNAGIVVLANGNYVIKSIYWHNNTASNAGAATWGSALTGVSGVVSEDNSLVGSSADDNVGSVFPLTNGNYVVSSPNWSAPGFANVGAATWGSGTAGVKGAISSANSLVGNATGDTVGYAVFALKNGNYVVASPNWGGSGVDRGAATWGNGSSGVKGTVGPGNSLIGASDNDFVSSGFVTELTNGNYIVESPSWSGAAAAVGAVTWVSGAGGTTGTVTIGNSLVGANAGDMVGSGGVSALSNGNFVVASPHWTNGASADAGAATWCSGGAATTGTVKASNSYVGTTASDQAAAHVAPLTNGNYVVQSPYWNNNSGAATWGNGTTGSVGPVSIGNSLIGSGQDQVGYFVTALTNGNYVVGSPYWSNGGTTWVGAATWGNGSTGITGSVSATNSLIGATSGDYVGFNRVTALSNGNYLVSSPLWSLDGAHTQVGAVTWGNGLGGTKGTVSSSNSLHGSTTNDQFGSATAAALSNGNYVVAGPNWDNPDSPGTPTPDAGVATWATGTGPTAGVVSFANSITGYWLGDKVGLFVSPLSNGNYVLRSSYFDNGSMNYVGDVALVRGFGPTKSSYVESLENVPNGAAIAYDAVRDQLVVGRPSVNKVTILRLELLFRDGFE